MQVGYARVSTQDQNPALQLDALQAGGCEKTFTEKASGAQRDRPELKAALDYIRAGDTLVVWKLDRLARSMRQLIETIELSICATASVLFDRNPSLSVCVALYRRLKRPSFSIDIPRQTEQP